MNGILIFFLVSSVCFVAAQNDEQPLAAAPIGKIRGSILTSRLGKKIYSFRGVRYGEPPTGHQRFQPPIPANDWENVFDASEEGPSCPYPGGTLQSEDCLRLNVYTTKLPCKTENVSRPVMIFIYPGGLYQYSGQSLLWGPEYIMDQDIVLVTINHRLGALGFISTGDNLLPGNMGLKDQVVALQWVQRNIAAFGGNPNSVTLVGDSSGSASVILHMVSPMSENLFHRAICMSSSPIAADPYSTIPRNGQKELAKKQAEVLGCPTDTTGSMLLCLYSKPVENFTNTVGMGSPFDWYGTPLVFKPTVEPESSKTEKFLTGHPYDLIVQRKFTNAVPVILGVTQDEVGGIAYSFTDAALRDLDQNWTSIAPYAFKYERDTPRSNYISDELRKFYFKDRPIDKNNLQGIHDIYADSVIIFPVFRAAKLFATYSDCPVYFYKFTYQGRYNFRKPQDPAPPVVGHVDDLQYLFYMKQFIPYFESDAPEIPMVEIETGMWSSFVKTGDPIPKDNERLKNVKWSTFVPAQTNFLDINLQPTMKNDFFPERMRTWERLFPLPSPSKTIMH